MNKIIILQKIGYSHPSQANWNYDVYQFYIAGEYRKYFKNKYMKKCKHEKKCSASTWCQSHSHTCRLCGIALTIN